MKINLAFASISFVCKSDRRSLQIEVMSIAEAAPDSPHLEKSKSS